MFGLFGKTKKQPTVAIEPPQAAIEEARQKPNGWVYAIEGDHGPNDAVPAHAIKGAWKVDANGKIVGDFIPNPNYRDSTRNSRVE